jgi:hypothetical protein
MTHRRLHLIAHLALALAVLCLALALHTDSVTAPAAPPTPTPSPVVIADQPPVPAAVTITGIATWYDATRNNAWYTRGNRAVEFYGAASPYLRSLRNFRWGGAQYRVIIRSHLTGREVVVVVTDTCSCYGRRDVIGDEPLIDLAPAVWDALGVRLGRGIMAIDLTILP